MLVEFQQRTLDLLDKRIAAEESAERRKASLSGTAKLHDENEALRRELRGGTEFDKREGEIAQSRAVGDLSKAEAASARAEAEQNQELKRQLEIRRQINAEVAQLAGWMKELRIEQDEQRRVAEARISPEALDIADALVENARQQEFFEAQLSNAQRDLRTAGRLPQLALRGSQEEARIVNAARAQDDPRQRQMVERLQALVTAANSNLVYLRQISEQLKGQFNVN
jgi:hypothetical protein